MAGRSAVIVPIRLPRRLAAVRSRFDWAAAHGVPPHVTILFPFLSAAVIGPAERGALAAIAHRQPAFVARFERGEERDGLIWMVPADDAPFLALTAAVVERWPDHPPYEGAHETLIAHLTLVESDDASARRTALEAVGETGTFSVGVAGIRLIIESPDGSWHTRWWFPLGEGPRQVAGARVSAEAPRSVRRRDQ